MLSVAENCRSFRSIFVPRKNGTNSSCSQRKPNRIQAQSTTVLSHEQLVRITLPTEVSHRSNRRHLAQSPKAQPHQTVGSIRLYAPSARISFPVPSDMDQGLGSLVQGSRTEPSVAHGNKLLSSRRFFLLQGIFVLFLSNALLLPFLISFSLSLVAALSSSGWHSDFLATGPLSPQWGSRESRSGVTVAGARLLSPALRARLKPTTNQRGPDLSRVESTRQPSVGGQSAGGSAGADCSLTFHQIHVMKFLRGQSNSIPCGRSTHIFFIGIAGICELPSPCATIWRSHTRYYV
jgi:hypothetical protein